MSFARSSLYAITAILLLLLTTHAAQAQSGPGVECVKRTATAAPPPHPTGPRRAATRQGIGEPKPAAPIMKPVCPEGQVPVTREMQIERNAAPKVLPKGNPLLRPQSGNAPAARPDVFTVLPGDVRTFEEIYRGPGNKSAQPPPPGPPACAGVPSFGSCYYYGSAALQRNADGGGMTMTVDAPIYVNTGGSGHSLNEISVQGGTNNGNIVELGWLVSSDQNGDSDPHIFVFHWKNWVQTCYNGCGWQQVSNTYYPGQDIKALIGRDVYIGYVFHEGNWWAWFDDQWLGYFPGSEWSGAYVKSALIQWFGEVASLNGIPPKTQMGDGLLPTSIKAARMFALCDVDAKAWVCFVRDQQSVTATVPKLYNIARAAFGDTRYGGPGQ